MKSRRISLGTLDSRIYSIFTIMIFITVFIMQLVAFQFAINRIRSSMLESNTTMANKVITKIDSYIEDIEPLSRLIADNSDVKKYLDSGGTLAQGVIRQRLADYIAAREDIANIVIIIPQGARLSGLPGTQVNPHASVEEKDWYRHALASPGQTVVSTSYVQNLIAGRYTWVVSLCTALVSPATGKLAGVLLIDLKFNRIKELCQSMAIGRTGYNFILDSQGNYVFHPTQQLVYSGLKNEPVELLLRQTEDYETEPYKYNSKYYKINRSRNTDWLLINVLHEGDINADWNNVRLAYSALGLFLFIIVGFATSRISAGITRPIKKLRDIMKSVETGDFHLVGTIDATDEIVELAREYDIMVGRIRELMRDNIHKQELKRKSDLKALQAQINPHFLYNTLDSIIWMAEMGQSEKVVDMTSALSKLFRISISKGKEIIRLREEIAHVKFYLTIQEIRYRDKFDYVFKIDPTIEDSECLKIILQPLVENAIYHGIKETDSKGLIEIEGWSEDDKIILEVRDNGCGMDAETLASLQRSLNEPDPSPGLPPRHGMGVRNVHERIQIYFGKKYGLTISSQAGHGTSIHMELPQNGGGSA